MIRKRLVKSTQLVHRVVPDERFTYKEDAVRLVHTHQLGQRSHQRLVVLHAPSCINKHHIHLLLRPDSNRLARNSRRVLAVPLVIQRYLKTRGVRLELLHCARSERVARCNQHSLAMLLEVEARFRERRRLADSVHAHKHNHIRALLCRHHALHVSQQFRALLRRKQTRERVIQGAAHCRPHGRHAVHALALKSRSDRPHQLFRNVCRHVLAHQHVLELLKNRFQVFVCQIMSPCESVKHRKHPSTRCFGRVCRAFILVLAFFFFSRKLTIRPFNQSIR
mmetsp:Transcript_9294/g.19613  ORF Transcript_9294/g.19613 Transcript_9294/m.19613 type:complete len:279 (-) Transcript_9294:41-877(-)